MGRPKQRSWRPRLRPGVLPLSLAGLGVLLPGPGCSASYHREQADEAALEILQEKQKEVFGEERPFSVEQDPDNPRARLLEAIQKSLQDGSGPPAPLELDMARTLEVAAACSREFQDQKESLFLSALSLSGTRWEFDWHPSLTATAGVDGNRRSATASGGVRAGLSKTLSTGATVLSSLLNSFSRSITSSQPWNASSLLSVGLTQPLLRGFGPDITLERLTQAERDAIYAVREFERYRRRLVVRLTTTFYRLLQQIDQIEIEEANLASLQQNLERNEALRDGGRVPKLQVDQTRQSILTSEARLLNAREALKSSLDSFKITLGLPMEAEIVLDRKAFQELKTRGLAPLEIAPEQALAIALGHRLDLKTSADEVEDAERFVAVAADALRIGLDLDLDVSTPSDPRVPGKPVWRDTTMGAGLSLDLPLDRTQQRNAYRRAIVSLERARRQKDLQADTVQQEIREGLRRLRQYEQDHAIQVRSVELSMSRVEETETKQQAGRAIIRDVLEARDSLRSAQSALSRVLVDYLTARLELLRDMEVLNLDPEGLSYDDRIDLAGLLQATQPEDSEKQGS